MAPESFGSSKNIDRRVDLFSLGVLSYELIVGARPFVGDSIGAVIDAVRHATPEAPRTRLPWLPESIEEFLLRALRKPPEKRFQTATEMCDAVRKIESSLDSLPPPESTGDRDCSA